MTTSTEPMTGEVLEDARAGERVGDGAHARPGLSYEELVDTIDGIVWEANTSFQFTFVSRQAEGLLGYPLSRWTEEPTFWVDHLHPDDRERCVKFCTEQIALHNPHQFEYRMLAADGRIVWLRDYVNPVTGDGRVTRLRGVMVDITRQKQMQEELERTVSLLRATFDSTADGLLVVDRERRTVAFNRQFAALWGIPEEVLGTRDDVALTDFVLAEVQDPGAFLDRVRWLYEHPEEESSDVIRFKDGRIFERYSQPQRLGGEVVGRVWSFRDVTKRRQAEEERVRLYREAQEAVRVRDDFLSIASHELKTPLTPLSLRLQGLEKALEKGAPVDIEQVRKARRHLDTLTSLINDLLDISRIQSGRLVLHPEPMPLRPLVREVVASFRPVSPKHQILLDEPREEVVVRADRSRLEQVLQNLVENAIKYSPDGGRVRVALSAGDGEALLSVSDEGIGIPREQQQRLFQRYFRAQNVSTRSYGGLGLGLYICRDIVERHGGRIQVESEEGSGSTFSVTLPLMQGGS